MQPPTTVPPVPSSQNQSGFVRRKGQIEWRNYLEAHGGEPWHWAFTARMPTGYGKTESILDGYDVLRRLCGCSRLLIVVPTQTQEDAYVKELVKKAKTMGISLFGLGVVSAISAPVTLTYHRKNQAEVFVMTVQRLVSAVSGRNARSNWLTDLISSGRWCGAADEYHHYADDNVWGQAFRQLPQVSPWMALSATPDRRQGETIFGNPVVNITYRHALDDEHVVKDVSFKVREYGVAIQVADGEVLKRTTSELREEINTEKIDQWEARKQLRYLTKYCSPILVQALGDLNDCHVHAPIGAYLPQMLVYGFSCAHAQSLCEIIRGHAPGLRVDWAGTGPHGRSDSENKRVINAFKGLDDQDRDVAPTLDVLVQVNIASEGFNCPPVCIIVDLALSGFSPQKLQAYGRGTRRYYAFPLTIYVPTDSNVASLAALRADLFDKPIDVLPPSEVCECCDRCPQCEHHEEQPKELPDLEVLDALLIGGQDYQPSPDVVAGVATVMNRREAAAGSSKRYDVAHNVEDYNFIRDVLTEYHQETQSQQSESTRRAYWTVKVTKAVGTVAYHVVMRKNGSHEKSLLADLCKRINGRWKWEHQGHDAMTSADFRTKYLWLKDLDHRVIAGELPLWLV